MKEEDRHSNSRGLSRKGAGGEGGSQTSRIHPLKPSIIEPRAWLLLLLTAWIVGVLFFSPLPFFQFLVVFFFVGSRLQLSRGGLGAGNEG